MNCLSKLSKKCLASPHIIWQIFGALIQWRGKMFLPFVCVFMLGVMPVTIGVSYVISPDNYHSCWYAPCLYLLGLNLILWLTIKVCLTLADVYSLRKNETGITWCYIFILISIGLWLLSFFLMFKVANNGKVTVLFGIVGAMLGWIFQDKIKGVVAFLHLRMNHLLNIGDWIRVPSFDVDGEVKRISLTTVTIYNWDTTTSTIPISVLHSGHFQNLQNMMDGKTYGRRMLKTFILDTSWFRPLSEEEIKRLYDKIDDYENNVKIPEENDKDQIYKNTLIKDIHSGMLNAQLFRNYIFHWLMNHDHISQRPFLVVRWQEQVEGGMPLQVYAFITDSNLAPFEWQQSLIIEHIIESLDWFGLRLYQSPSGYDVSNSNVFLSGQPTTYRKELKNEQ